MGTTYAMGLADAWYQGVTDVRQVLAIHLQNNHYPPVPLSMIDPCIEAIEAYEDGDGEARIQLPEGIRFGTDNWAPSRVLVESFHLTYFIDQQYYETER